MGKTDYKGVDYGLGMTNIDGSTGIRFGVIQHDKVGQAWWNGSEANYLYFCPKCEHELGYEFPDVCSDPECGYEIQDGDFDMLDPISFSYDQDGYAAEQGYDDPDIFILKSEFYTWCQFCSPCAPGAGNITNHMEPGEGIKAYCFGHDWFEEIETGKWIPCGRCLGTGLIKKIEIPNYDEVRLLENGVKIFDNKHVYCWSCFHNALTGNYGTVKEMVSKAPYPVYRVEDDSLVEV